MELTHPQPLNTDQSPHLSLPYLLATNMEAGLAMSTVLKAQSNHEI